MGSEEKMGRNYDFAIRLFVLLHGKLSVGNGSCSWFGPRRVFAKWYRLDGKRSLRRSRSSYFPGSAVLLL